MNPQPHRIKSTNLEQRVEKWEQRLAKLAADRDRKGYVQPPDSGVAEKQTLDGYNHKGICLARCLETAPIIACDALSCCQPSKPSTLMFLYSPKILLPSMPLTPTGGKVIKG